MHAQWSPGFCITVLHLLFVFLGFGIVLLNVLQFEFVGLDSDYSFLAGESTEICHGKRVMVLYLLFPLTTKKMRNDQRGLSRRQRWEHNQQHES